MSQTCSCGTRAESARNSTPITAEEIVADVSTRPGALEVFERLGINHCCGAHLSIREAAAAAGAALEEVLRTLNETASAAPRPAALATRRRVDLDVRDDIGQGIEPFARIMAAAKALRDGEALALRTPFEPVPLYNVLGRRGLAHWTERRAPDDWSVWFYRDATAPASAADAPPAVEGGRTLDVRGLEPPLPMVRVLERLDGLAEGEELEVIHDRRPLFLYPQLDERGFAHETDEPEPGVVRIRIGKRPRTSG